MKKLKIDQKEMPWLPEEIEYYDKYSSKNPVARYLMNNFIKTLHRLIDMTNASFIHEIGCGEGDLCVGLAEKGKAVHGTDLSTDLLRKAQTKAQEKGVSIGFRKASIYDLNPDVDGAELILCCEVLEHLQEPERALKRLHQLADPYLIASVPREPLWSLLNLARGAYISRFGNTPAHIQRWSKSGFVKFLSQLFDIIKVESPTPWTLVLCRRK